MDEEESTSAKVGGEAAGSGPTFFTPSQLSTSAHLITSTTVIPPFGQRHAPVVMTPQAVLEAPWALTKMVPQTATRVVPQVVTDVPQTVTDILPTAIPEVIPDILSTVVPKVILVVPTTSRESRCYSRSFAGSTVARARS